MPLHEYHCYLCQRNLLGHWGYSDIYRGPLGDGTWEICCNCCLELELNNFNYFAEKFIYLNPDNLLHYIKACTNKFPRPGQTINSNIMGIG